jgi:hypothetical protein
MITLGAGVDRSTWIMVRMPGMCPSLTGIKNTLVKKWFKGTVGDIFAIDLLYEQNAFISAVAGSYKADPNSY